MREITIDDKIEFIKMVEEISRDSTENKFEGLSNIKDVTENNYNEFLIDLEKSKNIKLYKPYLVDQTTFILVDKNNHIYGGTNIRHELNDSLLIHGGHIGYLIRPSERKKGYGSLILKLALEKCRELGIDKVLVTCREENISSKMVIESNDGIYENSKKGLDNKTYRRYWISLFKE